MNIIIKEKDEFVTFEEITEVLHSAHNSTKQDGLKYRAAYQSPVETEKRLRRGGKFFVALDGEQLIGVIAVNPARNLLRWLKVQEVSQIEMLGILEQYRGTGISTKLLQECEKIGLKEYGFIQADTAVQNVGAKRMYLKNGYVPVNYVSHVGTNYYSVVFGKWSNEKRVNKILCSYYYYINKFKCIIKYNKDGQKRRLFRYINIK